MLAGRVAHLFTLLRESGFFQEVEVGCRTLRASGLLAVASLPAVGGLASRRRGAVFDLSFVAVALTVASIPTN